MIARLSAARLLTFLAMICLLFVLPGIARPHDWFQEFNQNACNWQIDAQHSSSLYSAIVEDVGFSDPYNGCDTVQVVARFKTADNYWATDVNTDGSKPLDAIVNGGMSWLSYFQANAEPLGEPWVYKTVH